MNSILNPKRFLHLILNELVSNYKAILIAIGSVFGVLLIINVASVGSYKEWNFNLVFYPLVLFIGGFVVSSMAFSELFIKPRNIHYLSLPASSVEKLLAKLLLTTVGYILISLVLYEVFTLIASGITNIFFGIGHPVFNPFHPLIWKMIRLYIITQSVIFFGSVYFKKLALIKTMLALSAFGTAISILAGIIFRIVFAHYFKGMSFIGGPEFMQSFSFDPGMGPDIEKLMKFSAQAVKIAFFWVMPVFFWVVSYFRLKETEA